MSTSGRNFGGECGVLTHHDGLWQLAETLLTHGELAGLWRVRPVAVVERQIGAMSGTAAATWASFLRQRVPLRYCPLLWEPRVHL